MKKENISEILENISTKYIDEATLYTGKTKKLRFSAVKWGAVAACLSLALVAAFTVPKLSLSRSETEKGTEENAYAGGTENCAAGGEEIAGTTETAGLAENTGAIGPSGAFIGNDIAYEPPHEPTSENVAVSSETPDYPAMIMVNGKLYKAAGIAFMSVEEIVPDGKIVSTCDEKPTENDQSNFGTGYAYQIGKNDTVNVRFEDGWHVFELVGSSAAHGEDASVPGYAPPHTADAPPVEGSVGADVSANTTPAVAPSHTADKPPVEEPNGVSVSANTTSAVAPSQAADEPTAAADEFPIEENTEEGRAAADPDYLTGA